MYTRIMHKRLLLAISAKKSPWMGVFVGITLWVTTWCGHAETTPLTMPTLIIGTTQHYPPFAYMVSKGNFVGFEIELMEGICQRIHVHCEYRPYIVSEFTTQLSAGNIDLAIGTIIIPSKPLPYYLFSLPYLESSAQFMAEKNSPISTPADIKNKTVGVRKGTLYGGSMLGSLVRNIYANQVKILEYPTMDEMLIALQNHKVDILFTNQAAVRYWLANDANYKLVGPILPVGNGYGIMGKQGQEALLEKINQALLSMEGDDSYLQLYSKYFSENMK